jgi:sugar phosphate isomerase/epimerase
MLGNSGAPRWYDCDRSRFPRYLDLIQQAGATGAEIVLHDGDADEFTSRVHVLRQDWSEVIRGYRDRGLVISVHGPLTPEFSPKAWKDQPAETIRRYQPVLGQLAEIASDQGGVTLILHAVADRDASLGGNEIATARFLSAIAEECMAQDDSISIALELRAFRHDRPSAAATSRESVQRVLDMVDAPQVGLCWDIAHDLESHLALGEMWSTPPDSFLERIIHLHVHDLGPEGEPHYPPVVGRVPIERTLPSLRDIPTIMEVRWRMAERIGDPWEVLRRSYDVVSRIRRS